jgi:hypothetical protein
MSNRELSDVDRALAECLRVFARRGREIRLVREKHGCTTEEAVMLIDAERASQQSKPEPKPAEPP